MPGRLSLPGALADKCKKGKVGSREGWCPGLFEDWDVQFHIGIWVLCQLGVEESEAPK